VSVEGGKAIYFICRVFASKMNEIIEKINQKDSIFEAILTITILIR